MTETSNRKITMRSIIHVLIIVIGISFALFHLYTAAFGNLDSIRQRSVHLLFASLLVFLIKPATKKGKEQGFTIFDLMMIVCILSPVGYLLLNHESLLLRMYYVSPLNWYEYVLAAMLVVAVLEGTRRVMGLALPIIALLSIIYAFYGQYLPGEMGHGGISAVEMVDQIYLTTEGIFGIPLGVSATFVILFIIFGTFLMKTGIGDYFMDFAMSLTRNSRGGPAKTAVIGSAFFGSISGSAIANVATTGQLTIPMMKRVGYKPTFAGGVEAVASTGGQLMPPVMGAAVFIMVEFTGIPYIDILRHALLPALLYFISVYLMVDFESRKLGITNLKDATFPDIKTLLKRVYLFLPLVLLIYLLVIGFSPMYSVLYSLAFVLLLGIVNTKQRFGIKEISEALLEGAKNATAVALACACAGIIVGVASYSGLGLKLTSTVLSISDESVFLALILTMLATLVLGAGLPSVPAYIIVATLMVPALVGMDVPLIAAHLFAFYYAAIANITPPIALAAYTAAGIAQADAFKTGLAAFKLGIAAYIVPFMFIFHPQLLLISDSAVSLIQAISTALIGVFFLSAGVIGYLKGKALMIERVAFFATSLLLISGGLLTDILGIVIGTTVVVFHLSRNKKKPIQSKLESNKHQIV